MTTTYWLQDIADAVEIGTKLPFSWFRGHDREVRELTPRVFRTQQIPGLPPDWEVQLIEAFKRDARPVATGNLPAQNDTLGWLYLMQHHRTPTRLLDWTESMLAALFFAVGGDWRKRGEVWAMYPFALNEQAEVGRAMPLIEERNPVLEYLVREPYYRDRQDVLTAEIARQFENQVSEKWRSDPQPFKRPVAFEPRRDFARMLVQASVFTIHPQPSAGNSIPEILTDSRHLVRYIIPKGKKPDLWKDLRALGVTDRALFPDFEGLSRTIASLHGEEDRPPPEPPECGGPVEEEG